MDAFQESGIVRAEKSRILCHGFHGSCHIGSPDVSLRIVPGTVVGNAVIIQTQSEAGIAEQSVYVPPGRPIHGNLFLLCFGYVQHPVPGQYVLLREIFFIIIQKISIVRREGIGVQSIFHRCRIHSLGQVFFPQDIRIFHRFQGAGRHQGIQLVIRKGEYVGAVFQIFHQRVSAVAFALGLERDLKVCFSLIVRLKSVNDPAKQFLIFFGAPDRELYLVGNRLLRFLGKVGYAALTPGKGCDQQEKGRGP